MDSIVDKLPNDILVKITAAAASSSLVDLMNMKRACKDFCARGKEADVLHHACMETRPAIYWKLSRQEAAFLDACEKSRNPEVLFKRGMVQYFSRKDWQGGIDMLTEASGLGHPEAAYVLGIILFSEEHSRARGLEVLSRVEVVKMERCRERTKRILREMWINWVLPGGVTDQCSQTQCVGRRRCQRKRKWSDAFEEESFCSDICRWTSEQRTFAEMLVGR